MVLVDGVKGKRCPCCEVRSGIIQERLQIVVGVGRILHVETIGIVPELGEDVFELRAQLRRLAALQEIDGEELKHKGLDLDVCVGSATSFSSFVGSQTPLSRMCSTCTCRLVLRQCFSTSLLMQEGVATLFVVYLPGTTSILKSVRETRAPFSITRRAECFR